MNNHEYYEQLLSTYIDAEASQEETQILIDHLAGCVSCQKQYRELIKLSLKLQEWPEEELSPDLHQKIKSALENEGTKEKPMPLGLTRKILARSGVFVVLLAVIFVFQVYVKRGIQGRLHTASDDIGDQFYPGKSELLKDKTATPPTRESYRAKKENKGGTMAAGLMAKVSQSTAVPASHPTTVVAEFWGGDAQYEPYYLASNDEMDAQIQPTKMPVIGGDFNTESYSRIYDNKFLEVTQNPLSTFSIDVDTASYSNIRRFLMNGQMPNEDAVRIEEMINYFSYDYPQPKDNEPFSITTKAAICPWNPSHQLALVGLQGKKLEAAELPPSNLVFLIDVSGSMMDADKLPLLKRGFQMMVNQLGSNERVAIVVYAGAAGKVLDSTSGSDRRTILNAIENLQAGGSTAGGEGIKLAYQIARENFIKNGNNRVILATDGDFNVGVSSDAEMVRLIEKERNGGVFLTVLGFGTGNYKDSKMEQIADKGNGNYYYIDNLNEAKKVLVQELGSTIFTIAKDVKVQIEFNPAQIKAYRLIGYENRVLAKEDFNDDTKDAGELGAGHTVTALYEIIPADSSEQVNNVDALTYQKSQIVPSADLMTVKLRYKEPDADISKLITQVVSKNEIQSEPTDDFAFAAVVAEFGMLLRNSEFKGSSNYEHVIKSAQSALGKDSFGYRQEFLSLVEKAKSLDFRSESSGQGIQFK